MVKGKLAKHKKVSKYYENDYGPTRWAGSPRSGVFYPSFIWNFLFHFKTFFLPQEKDGFDHLRFKGNFFYFNVAPRF